MESVKKPTTLWRHAASWSHSSPAACRLFSAATLVAVLSPMTWAAPATLAPAGGEYVYEALTTPANSSAFGINDVGQIVGSVGDGDAFLYENGAWTSFSFPGAARTSANDINNAGEIVGDYSLDGTTNGYLRDEDGNYTTIMMPNAQSTWVLGMNNRGDLAGYFLDSAGLFRGFKRDKQGVYTTIDFPDATATFADDINDKQEVVGEYNDSTGFVHGLVRTTDGVLTSVDVGPPAIMNNTSGINNRRDLAGIYLTSSFDLLGFVLTKQGVFHSILFPGSDGNFVFHMNSNRDVVGSFFGSAGSGAFVARWVDDDD